MSKHQLYCEICRECIGIFHLEDIEEPITGAMFNSKDPRHGFPPPFRSPALEWEDMQCPYCNHRPFLAKGFLLTERGHWSIEAKEFMDAPRAGLDERALIDKRLHERPDRDHDADIRARIDADRMPPPTEAIPMNYGPDAPPPEVIENQPEEEATHSYLDKTPEEKQADIARRIEQDAAEDGGEDGDSGHIDKPTKGHESGSPE